jgi:peroxiredoxin
MPVGHQVVDVGEQAPDFELTDQHGQSVRLSSFRGREAVLLVFYPFAFTRVCGGELHALEAVRDELAASGVALLANTVD